jgi:hypothetical protein|tara:strand:- start:216 stop:668 length:453 start_codon:yes stop_codon:yes gene_type:complete
MKQDIKEIIDWTLKKIDMHSKDASSLIYKTGMAESGYRALSQMGEGPAIGFFQLEPATMKDIMENYVAYRKPILESLKSLGYAEDDSEYRVKSNIALQVAFCRLKYKRDPFPLPSWWNTRDQAEYWKRVYNTELGKGTVEHFLEANQESI